MGSEGKGLSSPEIGSPNHPPQFVPIKRLEEEKLSSIGQTSSGFF
jgi:hypothetical protein